MATARALVLFLATATACGSSTPPPAGPGEPASSSEPSAPASSGGEAAAAPESSGAPDEPASAAKETESESLARDLVKSGGRRIGYSATKKSWVHPLTRRTGQSSSLDIVFTDEEGRAKDTTRICQAGECDEQLESLAKAAIPKLAGRLDSDGYAGVKAIGWPSGRDELEVSALGMKLKLTGGRLEGIREGKPPAPIGSVKPKLLALFVVPEAKRMGVFTSPDGEPGNQVFSVLKLP
jgi:hypothetical protein